VRRCRRRSSFGRRIIRINGSSIRKIPPSSRNSQTNETIDACCSQDAVQRRVGAFGRGDGIGAAAMNAAFICASIVCVCGS
jgi:hypothetical protein